MPCGRVELEKRERLILVPYAQFSAETRGRKYKEDPPEWRAGRPFDSREGGRPAMQADCRTALCDTNALEFVFLAKSANALVSRR